DPRHPRARHRLPHGPPADLPAGGDLHGAAVVRRAGIALLALLAPLILGQAQPRPGEAQPRLVPDVSQEHIEIRYSFSGAELLLFGAILYPGGQTPARPPDIAVVLKGPL